MNFDGGVAHLRLGVLSQQAISSCSCCEIARVMPTAEALLVLNLTGQKISNRIKRVAEKPASRGTG